MGLLGAIGSIAGGVAGAAMSARQAERNMKMQIEWEREKAKNAHQYEVQDLKAAGLNPVLSADGSGANMGSINPQMPDYGNMANNITSALNMMRQEKVDKSNIDNANADTALKEQETINKAAEKGNIEANTAKTLSENNLVKQQGDKIKSEIQLQQSQIEGIKSNNSLNDAQKKRIASEIKRNMYENKRTLKQIEKENWNMRNNIGTSIPSAVSSLIKGGVKGTMATSEYGIKKIRNRKPMTAKQLNKYKGGIGMK